MSADAAVGLPDTQALLDRHVVFDLDGTLVHTAPTLAWAIDTALARADSPPLGVERAARCIGHGLEAFAIQALDALGVDDPERRDRVRTDFLTLAAESPAHLAEPRRGADRLLVALRADGRRVGVCTNKHEPAARALLASIGLEAGVDVLVGATPDTAPKPAPDRLELCIARLGADVSSAVYVGDSSVDAATAAAAGCRFVLVRGGYEPDETAQFDADAVVDELDDLLAPDDRPGRGDG